MEGIIRPKGKPSKASLTSVSAGRKIRDESVPKTIIKQTQLCFRLSDVCISLLVIFPLVIGFWRGVWNLTHYYSNLYDVEPWLSVGLGYAIPFVLYWFQEPLRKHVHPRKMNFIVFYITSRYLLFLHSFGCVNQWRGLWALMDIHTGTDTFSATVSLVVGVAFSILLKTFCNALAPPLFLAVDEAYSIHDCPLRFRTSPKLKCPYVVDCFSSVFVTASLVISCWRGLWELADLYLYPNTPILSGSISLGLGYLIVLMLFLCQPYITRTIEKLGGVIRLIVADLVTFIGFVGCVFSWRGLWMVYDELMGTPNVSDWVTTVVGAIGTLVLGCISSIIVRGVAVDGEVSDDGTSEWPIPYVSLLRDSVYDVPFPEPWLFRILCTNQKMNCHQIYVKKDKEGKMQDGNVRKSDHMIPAILHTAATNDDPASSIMVPMVDLASLRNIDSSSDEDDDTDLVVSIVKTSSNAVTTAGESLHGESEELEPLRVDETRDELAKSEDVMNENSREEKISRKSIEAVVSSHQHHQSVQGGKA